MQQIQTCWYLGRVKDYICLLIGVSFKSWGLVMISQSHILLKGVTVSDIFDSSNELDFKHWNHSSAQWKA